MCSLCSNECRISFLLIIRPACLFGVRAFAAGAMLYVVVEELVPEYSGGRHSNIGTIGFALGFALMMVLDVLLNSSHIR